MPVLSPVSVLVIAIAALAALAVFRLFGGGWRLGFALALWFLAALALSLIGFFRDPGSLDATDAADLIGFMLFGTAMTLPVLGMLVMLRWSCWFSTRLAAVPTYRLVALQFYRVGGAAFLMLLVAGELPASFALPTGLLDMAVGLAAVPLAMWLRRRPRAARPVVIAWCIAGLGDFVQSISYVVAAMFGLIAPVPEPTMIGLHPLALISLFLVPIAIMAQGTVLLRLLKSQDMATATPG